MLKNPGLPDPTGGSLLGELCIAPQDLLAGGKGTRCPIPNKSTSVLGPSIILRFYRSQSLTHYRVVNRKYDYYTINMQ